jgi:hypothetical protein
MLKALLIVLILLLVQLSDKEPAAMAEVTVDTPTVEFTVERYIQALGGIEAIQALQTRTAVGHTLTDLSWKEPQVEVSRFTAYSKTPDKVMVVIEQNGEEFREGFDGAVNWRTEGEDLGGGPPFGRNKLAWLLNPQNALRLEEYFPELSYAGTRTVCGRLAYVLQPAELKENYFSLSFDVESGLLTCIGYHWELHDYRRIDGVLFPHRIRMDRKGGLSTYLFDSVTHNSPIDDMLFAAPDAAVDTGISGQ